jgi:diacylglycerol kinase (ATP)
MMSRGEWRPPGGAAAGKSNRAMKPPDTIESGHKGARGLKRIINAFFYSMSGLKLAFVHEEAFRQELLLAVVLLPVACLIPVTAVERVLLIGSVLIVLIVELLNSSIEAAVDRSGLDTHPLAKRAKDIGSAAVLLALILLAAAWLPIAGPLLLAALQNGTR